MKPSQRNAIRSKAKQASAAISRLERALVKFTPGTLPHIKLNAELAQAKAEKLAAETSLANRS